MSTENTQNNVVSLTERRKAQEERNLDDIFYCADEALDVIEDNFDMGVVIGLIGDEIQVTSTEENIDMIIFMLEEALYNVRNNY